MSGRVAEKERRRQQRVERERAAQRAERRTRARRSIVAGGVALLAISAVTALLAFGGEDSSASRAATMKGPFGQHYEGLDARREAAQIPTMMQAMGSQTHAHPHLWVYVDGEQVSVPANIGIDPDQDAMQMAGLHTHDATGKLHVEGLERATLGQFFSIWGVAFSKDRLGPHRAMANKTVRMWVDGNPSDAFGRLQLRDGQRIVVSYGPKDAPAPGGIER